MSTVASNTILGRANISPTITAGFPTNPAFPGYTAGQVGPTAIGGAGAGASNPTPVGPTAGIGDIAVTFERDWFERIHVIPGRIDLGNVLQVQIDTTEVYNAYRNSQQTLAQILEFNTAGVQLSGPPAPPLVYEPYESRTYTVTVDDEGPADIAALFAFDFTIQSPTLLVTGTRVITFAYPAQRPLVEATEWLTDVMESYRGLEQRFAIRQLPRQSYEMTYRFEDPVTVATIRNTLAGQLGRPFGVPLWQYREQLLADISAGATVVPVDTSTADFLDGGTAILWTSETDFEVVEIDTVGVGQLNLVRPTSNPHEAIDTEVYPMRTSLATDGIQLRQTPNGVLTFQVEWLADEYADIATPDGSLTLYQGSPVVAGLNFVQGELQQNILAKYELLDNDSGALTAVTRRDFPELGNAKRWEPETPADLRAVRGLIYALRGRQRTFWLPTFNRDFNLVTTINPTDVSIEVSRVEYTRFVDTQEPLNHIEIELNDGTIFRREITASAEGATTETLTIDSQLGQTVAPADVRRISYLVLSRLSVDRVEIQHNGQGRAIIGVPVAGVLQ